MPGAHFWDKLAKKMTCSSKPSWHPLSTKFRCHWLAAKNAKLPVSVPGGHQE